MKKILFIPDAHIPYHDKRAWRVLLRAARVFKPNKLVILGDFADFYCVSSHDKDPNRKNNLEWEVGEVNKKLNQLDELGADSKHFIAGNHENRLERYLATKAPEIFNMVEIPKLFKLKERGWDYTPYKDTKAIGKLNATHDVNTAGRNAVYRALDTFQHNVVTGHTHRLGYVVEGNAKGEAHVSASFGWLGDKEQADYMHKVKANRDWALGFGTGYQLDNGIVHVQPVALVNYGCMVEGQYVR